MVCLRALAVPTLVKASAAAAPDSAEVCERWRSFIAVPRGSAPATWRLSEMSGPKGRRWRARASWLLAVAAGCLVVPAAMATAADVDTVRLKNGDRLTCEIKKLEQGV